MLSCICLIYFLLKTNSYHFRRCVCRRKVCNHDDICETNSDCGRDKCNRKGKCVTTKTPNKDGDFVFGDIVMSGSHYRKKHGQWRNHR